MCEKMTSLVFLGLRLVDRKHWQIIQGFKKICSFKKFSKNFQNRDNVLDMNEPGSIQNSNKE